MLNHWLSSKSALVWSVLLALALQIAVLAFLGIHHPGPVLSQAMQAVVAFLAGFACLRAGQRGSAFAKSYWRLCGLAFLIWGVAQTLGTYHLYLATFTSQAAPRGIILYFFSFTPFFAALFLPSDAANRQTRWETYLDFVLIVIISSALYLLFLHAPWWQLTPAEWVSRRAATVNFRNFLLTAGFLARLLTSRSSQQRGLYTRIGVPISLYSLGFWIGKRGITLWANQLGTWFDLGWTLPFALVVAFAEAWQDLPDKEHRQENKLAGFGPFLLTFLVSLSLPLVVVWIILTRGSLSTPEVFLVCGAGVSIVICFFLRVAFVQYRQRRTFEKLQDSEQRYRLLFEHNLVGVFRTTPEGKYLDCNEAYARIFGYASREEALAGTPAELYVNPETRVERLAMLRKQRTITNLESVQRRKDGNLIWILQNVTLMQDDKGNEFVEGTVIDVTERKLAEAKTAEWKNRYDAAVLASGQIIYDWNPLTNEVTFGGNFERILGFTVDEISAGKNRWRELIHPEDLERYIKAVDDALKGSQPLHIEYRVRRKNGQYAIMKEEGGQFIVSEPGKISRMAGFISDVTDQRMLESQLRQSQKMEAVGRLAGGLAHDFNNLLTVIKGYSRMVLDDTGSKGKLRANVEHIDAAAERAASLTQHLLAFSRKQVLQPKVIDLNELIAGLNNMLPRLIGEDIEVVISPSRELGFVNADPSQIEQVIMNLVVNARDAMPSGGQLTLETHNVELDAAYATDHEGVHAGPYVMLAVSDTGVGMDPQTQSRIFEPFFTTKELGRGTGLGLSTVYGIVKQSGGHIWVYSEIGRGTTFKIYLARVKAPPAQAQQPARPTVSAHGTETILLVEDDELVRELTNSLLTRFGYRVLIAENLSVLSEVLAESKEKVDLLLTDVVMPQISGREVANRVTARWPGIKVLYMSGYTENAIVHHGVLDTGTHFLAKPFTPAALAGKLREILDSSPRTA